jgi:hypothetical protein
MLNPTKNRQRTKEIALLIVFTALYIVLRFVPYSILIGGAGAYLSLSDFIVPIIGILLGPYLGGACVLLGNFGALAFGRPITFAGFGGALDFLPDFVAVVSAGFLIRRKWLPVVALNAVLLGIFFVNPLTSILVTIPATNIVFLFAWMHVVAFILLLSPMSLKAASWVDVAKSTKLVTAGIIIIAFIATMMQHLMGNILFEIAFGQIGNPPIIPVVAWPAEWAGVFFAYPVERTILIVSTVLVGTPVIWAVSKNPHFRQPKQQNPSDQPDKTTSK